MKSFLVIICFSFAFIGSSLAQNKSLGVGIANPNTNAALHVESPTNNQGFIMPRLTTAQRTAMSGILTITDAGLMLYDIDLADVYLWNGSEWKTTAEVAGGARLNYPYVDTVTSSTANSNLFRLVYAGSGVENVGVAHFENLNPESGFSAIFGRTNSLTNGVADFTSTNPLNNNDAIGVSTNGVGTAGRFTSTNPNNQSFAVFAQINNDTLGAAIHGNNIGNGFGVFGQSSGTKFGSAAVYGLHVGTGDAAGAFRIANAASPYAGLYGETNGTGSAVFGKNIGVSGSSGYFQTGNDTSSTNTSPTVFAAQLGMGRAGQFQITNIANTNPAIRAFTSGLSNAGYFTISNPANTFPAIYGETNGIAPSVAGESSGTGSAARFSINNASNLSTALLITTNGLGQVANFNQTNASSTQTAVFVNSQGGNGFWANHNGATGYAGIFQNINPLNNTPSLFASTASNGAAFRADTDQGGNAIEGSVFNTGSGSAGYFTIDNASNIRPALYASTTGSGSVDASAILGETATGFSAIIGRATGGFSNGVSGISTASDPGSYAVLGSNSGGGLAGAFTISNAANASPSLQSRTIGTGNAGEFIVNNVSSTSSALSATTNTTSFGTAISASNTGSGDAVYATAVDGSAGNFQNVTGTGSNAALFGLHSSADGSAIGALNNNASGRAFSIFQGGMQVSTYELTVDEDIVTRAAAYRASGAGTTFTISFASTTGDMFMVYNDTASEISFAGVSIPSGTGKIIINFNNGSFRGL